MLLVLSSCDHIKVNGKEISTGVKDEMIEIFQGEEELVIVQVLRNNACTGHAPRVDVGTQTDLTDSWTDVEYPAFHSTAVSDRCFLHRPAPDRHCNATEYLPHTSHAMESEHDPVYEEMEVVKLKYYQEMSLGSSSCYTINEEQPSISLNKTDDDSKANRDTRPEPSNLQDQDSGLGHVDGSRQNDEEDDRWGPGCRSDLLTGDELPLRDSITSDECSDSGFYSISPGEYQRFQKALERKCRQYTSRSKSELGREAPTEEETKSGQKTNLTNDSKILQMLEIQNKNRKCWKNSAGPATSVKRNIESAFRVRTLCQDTDGNNPRNELDRSQEGGENGAGERTDLTERPPVMDRPKRLQTCSTSNSCYHRETSSSANRSRSCQQNNSVVPLKNCPNKTQLSLPSRNSGALNRESIMGENIEGEKEEGKKTGEELPSAGRYNHESDSQTSSWGSVYIPQHARHYQSYMQLVQQKAAVQCSESLSAAGEVDGETPRSMSSLEDDRSCFTAEKQRRDRLLKDRAVKIGEERNGTTTEDDGWSEIKMGRYWSKVERRQHWMLAKEKRQRRAAMMRSRLEVVEESGQAVASGRAQTNIIELSQRKVSRKRNKKVFDNWVTIQELLAHGSRSADGTVAYSPLLSVTTV